MRLQSDTPESTAPSARPTVAPLSFDDVVRRPPASLETSENYESELDGEALERLNTEPVVAPTSRLPLKRLLGIGLLAIGLIAAIAVGLRIASSSPKDIQNASLTSPSSKLRQQQVPIGALNKKLGTITDIAENAITVNGSLVLTPTVQPTAPISGQLYYSQATDRMQYYNGTAFVSLQGGGNTNVTNNNYASPVINNITNVSNVSGGGNVSTSNSSTGDLAVFNGNNTLGNSLISESGTTLTVGAGASTLAMQAALGGATLETTSATGSSGSIVIQSGASSTVASGNVTVDTGAGVITGEVVGDDTFEDGADNITNWYDDTVVQSNAQAHSGTESLAVTTTSQFWGISDNANFPNLDTAVVAGHHYYFTAWVRAATTPAQITGAICWNYTTCDDVTLTTVTDNSTSWTEMTGTAIAPGGATTASWLFSSSDSVAGDTHYFDDLVITDLSASSSVSALNLGATNAQFVTLGNMNEIGPTSINGGSGIILASGAGPISASGGAITLSAAASSSLTTSSGTLTLGAGGGTGGGVIVRPEADSTNAFQVQDASTQTTLLDVDTTNNIISLGTGAGSSLGYSGIGSGSGAGTGVPDTLSAQRVTSAAGGTITSISAYIGTYGINISPYNEYQFALYADNGSGTAPGDYIASSAVGTLGSSPTWYTLPITATLAANTTYWLVYWQNNNGTNSNNGFSYVPAPVSGALYVTAGTYTWQSGPNNGFPTTFPSISYEDAALGSIYANYAASGPALTISSAGTLTQNGAVIFQDPTDSTNAFQVQNSLGNMLLSADTADMQITVGGALIVTGSITVDGHIITGGSTPTFAAGTAACTTPTLSVTGDDTTGTITLTTGSGCVVSGDLATVTFASPFESIPHVLITPDDAASASLNVYNDYSNLSVNGFSIGTASVPDSSTQYRWEYEALQ